MNLLQFIKPGAKFSFKRRVLLILLIGVLLSLAIPLAFYMSSIWEKWELQEPKYPVGIENEAIRLLDIPHSFLLKENFDRDGMIVSFIKGLKTPFYKSILNKVPASDGERIYWRWYYESYLDNSTSEKLMQSFQSMEQDFSTLVDVPIANKYLDSVWRYMALESISTFLLKHINETKLNNKDRITLTRRIIETRLELLNKMNVDQFSKGKYSTLLQGISPIPDEEKYAPMLFFINTYHFIFKITPLSCDDPLTKSILPLQFKILGLLSYYKTMELSALYKRILEEDIVYINRNFLRNSKILKEKCNLS